jgi:ABC-type nitrate/sulfonate/bicarbonate transport system permease component
VKLSHRRAVVIAAPVAALVVLLGIWELFVDISGTDPIVLPAPHAIASALYVHRGELFSNFLVTAKEIVLGILCGVVIALILAVGIHLNRLLRLALYPLLIASQAVPTVLVAPLLVIWLGFGLGPKLVIIALVTFFPVVITTLAGLEATDPELIKLMRTFGAGRWQTFRYAEMPAALPGLFTGVKLAAVFSVIGAVFAEQTGVSSGLGYLFTISDNNLQVPVAYAAVVLLAAFAIVLFVLVTVAEATLLPWARADTARLGSWKRSSSILQR